MSNHKFCDLYKLYVADKALIYASYLEQAKSILVNMQNLRGANGF